MCAEFTGGVASDIVDGNLDGEHLVQSTAGSIAATWHSNLDNDNYGAMVIAFKKGAETNHQGDFMPFFR